MKLTKTQKIVAATVLVVAIVILLASCGSAVSNEVKTDSTEMKVDSLSIDTLKK